MSAWTVVTVVRDGTLQVIGILEGAYGLTDGPRDEEASEMAAHVIEAGSREEADNIVRERYYPKEVVPNAGGEPPC